MDRAVELDPAGAWVHAQRGATLGELGRYQEALAAFDHAIEFRLSEPWVAAERGATLGSLGRVEEAIIELDRAVEADPDNDWISYRRAQTLLRLGDEAGARAALADAIDRAQAHQKQRPTVIHCVHLALYRTALGNTVSLWHQLDALGAEWMLFKPYALHDLRKLKQLIGDPANVDDAIRDLLESAG